MRHRYECRTRWADLDLLGHVNNVVFVDYLQQARLDLVRRLRADGGWPSAEQSPGQPAEGLVVVRSSITYLAPLALRFRPVSVEVWVTEIRAASFTLGYEVFHEDDDAPGGRIVYVRASTVLTPYRFDARLPRRLSGSEREALAHLREDGDAPLTAPVESLDRERAHHYPVEVRFSDIDRLGHVNNVKYLEYAQEARVRFLGELSRGLDIAPPAVVVAHSDVDHRGQALLRTDPYDLWSSITRVGARSLRIASEMTDGDDVLARIAVVMVFFDTATARSAEPPAALRERLLASM